MLIFDATNVIGSLFSAPTGIIRYERMLFSAFLENFGSRARFITFDNQSKTFFYLTESDIVFIAKIYSPDELIGYSNFYDFKFLKLIGSTSRFIRKQVRKRVSVELKLLMKLEKSISSFFLYVFTRAILKIIEAYNINNEPYIYDQNEKLILSFMTAISMHKNDFDFKNISEASIIFYDTIPLDKPETTTDYIRQWFKPTFIKLIPNLNKIYCISEYTKRCVLKWLHNFNFNKFPEIQAVVSSSPLFGKSLDETPIYSLKDVEYVLYCSTIEPRKNHLLLLGIWQKFLEDGVIPPKLVFVGALGWGYEPVLAFLSANDSLKEYVEILSNINDSELTWLYKNSRFSVFPSIDEGWGLGATEALDFGKPIIVSKIDSLIEATQGLMPVIDPHDFTSWYRIIYEWSFNDQIIFEKTKLIYNNYRNFNAEQCAMQFI